VVLLGHWTVRFEGKDIYNNTVYDISAESLNQILSFTLLYAGSGFCFEKPLRLNQMVIDLLKILVLVVILFFGINIDLKEDVRDEVYVVPTLAFHASLSVWVAWVLIWSYHASTMPDLWDLLLPILYGVVTCLAIGTGAVKLQPSEKISPLSMRVSQLAILLSVIGLCYYVMKIPRLKLT